MEGSSSAASEPPHGGSRGVDVPFARGGPIFVPDLVGPITSVPAFGVSVINELNSLEEELIPADDFDGELSVDELRVFSEEELVERALREGFEDAQKDDDALWLGGSTSGVALDHSSVLGKEIVSSGNLANEDNLKASTSSAVESINGKTRKSSQQKKSNKRGRVFDRHSRAAELEGSYLTKVNELAKIKQKQDEDKLAARLHSFSGSSISSKCAIPNTEKIERMRSLRFISAPVKMKSSGTRELVSKHQIDAHTEVVLCAEIYHNKLSSKKTQEFLILGSQFLSDLRDNIYCLTDELMRTAGQHDPSGYFLIEDTFYNDLRDPSAIDYSANILDWFNNCQNEAVEKWEFIMSGEMNKMQKELIGTADTSSLPNLKAACMHEKRFIDLHFRLGAGYLYCHQGNCKHIIVIRDMRLLHSEDVQNTADYPLMTFQLRPRRHKCSVCKIFMATKMTVDDRWAQKNPCYFCIKCYFLLHYREDGTLLYDHSVFDYYHD